MTENAKTPAIRFDGFADNWEQRKVGELAEFNPKAELPDTFEYVDLESVVGTEMISHREESRASAPSRAQRLARYGDLFYQTVRPYQKNNYLFEKPDNNYVFSTGYAQMRPNCDSKFLLCLVQTDVFVKYVLDRCTGTSYPAINANDLADMGISVPKNDLEQKEIGSFFTGLDNLITIHQRKYDKLVTIKNAMLEKMFPKNGSRFPEIRFSGFTDAWEQRKLVDVVVSHNAGVYISKENYGYGTNIIGVGNIYDGDAVDGELYRLAPVMDDKFLLKKGDLLYGESSLVPEGIARTMYVTENGAGTAFAWHTRRVEIDQEKVNPHVLTLQINYANNPRNHLIRVSTQTALTGMTTEGYFSTPISYPSIDEQKKISSFFTEIDNLITLHQRELEKLKNLKKAFLEKMFV